MKKKEEHIIIEKQSSILEIEIGKWLLDVSKYVATAVIITTFLGGIEKIWLIYLVGVIISGICFYGGVRLMKNKPKK